MKTTININSAFKRTLDFHRENGWDVSTTTEISNANYDFEKIRLYTIVFEKENKTFLLDKDYESVYAIVFSSHEDYCYHFFARNLKFTSLSIFLIKNR
jgi:hypothetical protein